MNEHWPEISLSQLATITMGQSPEAACVSTDERGLAFLQGCAEFGARVPSPKLHCSPPLRVAKAGSVLISVRAPVGTTNFADQDYCIGRGLGAVTAKPEAADNIFLLHAMEKNVGFLHRRSQGSTFLAIGSKELSALPVPALPLATQRRIAKILSTVDEAIDQTEALIAKYQQIKAGLMQDLFTRGLSPEASAKGDVTWTLRPTRTQALHFYNESPLGWIPKEWEVKPLRDIATYQHGQPFPSTDYSDEGVLLLRPGNLHVSGVVRFDATHTTRIPQRWLRDCPELTVKQNDIVMNLTAQSLEDQFLGRVCIVKDGEPSLLNQRIARFFPRQVDHHFLYWILRSLQFRNQIDRTAQGTKVQHLYNSDLNRVMFAIPKSQQEQERVAGLLLTATESLVAGESSIAKLRQQKQGLMQDLLTGRVRVKVGEAEEQS